MNIYPRSLFMLRTGLRDTLRGYDRGLVRIAERLALDTAARQDVLHGYRAGLDFARHSMAPTDSPPRSAA